MLRLLLVPLDERPVNTRYPAMLAAIGGAKLALPPDAIRGQGRRGADLNALQDWLRAEASHCAAALVSADFLAYGNLIQSRISAECAADCLARLRLLRELHDGGCSVHAFSVITRVPDANDCVEEPDYWGEWGTRCARWARLAHRAEKETLPESDRLALDTPAFPDTVRADWLTRRLRNHAVNLGLLDMAARGSIASLRLVSNDTAPFGLPSRERAWLAGWVNLVGLAPGERVLGARVLMHPGADEVGSALVAALLNAHVQQAPRVFVCYAFPADACVVAPYEDRPVRETVAGQIAACGCVPADTVDECDFVLGVATPVPGRGDYRLEYLAGDRQARGLDYAAFLARLGAWQQGGKPIALADVAYPNGADPLLMESLLSPASPLLPGALQAFGAWNTAGNTLGTVIAQASCALQAGADPVRQQAQRAFLLHRFLEDWGYQSVVRRAARAEAARLWGQEERCEPSTAEEAALLCAFIENGLRACLGKLQARGIGDGLSLVPGSVRLPWARLFEIDFTLKEPAP